MKAAIAVKSDFSCLQDEAKSAELMQAIKKNVATGVNLFGNNQAIENNLVGSGMSLLTKSFLSHPDFKDSVILIDKGGSYKNLEKKIRGANAKKRVTK